MFAVALHMTLVIEKGATLEHVLTVLTGEPPTALNLTGCAAQLKVKPTWDSTTVLADFSTANGKLVITAAAGEIAFNVSDEETLAMTWEPGVCALYLYWPNGKTWVLGRGPAFVEVGTR
jgi:type 1 fimbria pilin